MEIAVKGIPVSGERFTDENYRYGKGWSVFFLKLLYYICLVFMAFTSLFLCVMALFVTNQL